MANSSYWLWHIRVALGRSNSFKLQQSTRLQGSQRLSMERGQTVQMKCTRVWLGPGYLKPRFQVRNVASLFAMTNGCYVFPASSSHSSVVLLPSNSFNPDFSNWFSAKFSHFPAAHLSEFFPFCFAFFFLFSSLFFCFLPSSCYRSFLTYISGLLKLQQKKFC